VSATALFWFSAPLPAGPSRGAPGGERAPTATRAIFDRATASLLGANPENLSNADRLCGTEESGQPTSSPGQITDDQGNLEHHRTVRLAQSHAWAHRRSGPGKVETIANVERLPAG
jgi:hypothetical protein